MYRGHDIKQWDHYRTPRTYDGLYVDRSHPGDRLVFKVAILIGAVMGLLIAYGVI